MPPGVFSLGSIVGSKLAPTKVEKGKYHCFWNQREIFFAARCVTPTFTQWTAIKTSREGKFGVLGSNAPILRRTVPSKLIQSWLSDRYLGRSHFWTAFQIIPNILETELLCRSFTSLSKKYPAYTNRIWAGGGKENKEKSWMWLNVFSDTTFLMHKWKYLDHWPVFPLSEADVSIPRSELPSTTESLAEGYLQFFSKPCLLQDFRTDVLLLYRTAVLRNCSSYWIDLFLGNESIILVPNDKYITETHR